MIDGMQTFWTEALGIWRDGGWAMLAIASIAVVLFGLGVHVQRVLRSKELGKYPESSWRRWIEHGEQREGKLGRLLDKVSEVDSLKETTAAFQQLNVAEIGPLQRDLKVMKICVSAAPLVGLLGTVTGMLATFGALGGGSGDQTMSLIAGGISQALITTETGLVIALPGLFFHYLLQRKTERYQTFLAHLETVCTQTLYRNERRRARREVQAAARRVLAERLLEAMQRRQVRIADRTRSADAPPKAPAPPFGRARGTAAGARR